MIGAMPAVAVRHERRRQEKRTKRPSQLYLGGQWMPPPSGSPPSTSPHGHTSHFEQLPELYLCGKISGLNAVVVCLLLGAVLLVVGLVQLAPGATTTEYRLGLLIAGSTLLLFGIILAGVRCYVLHCMPLPTDSPAPTPLPPPPTTTATTTTSTTTTNQSSASRGTLDLLVGHSNPVDNKRQMIHQHQQPQQQQQQHHHHHRHHDNNHRKKRSSQCSESGVA